MKVFSSLSALGARWRSKCRPRSANKLSPMTRDQIEPKLVVVQERQAGDSDEEVHNDSAIYGTPVQNWSLIMSQPHLLPRRASGSVSSVGLILPFDALALVMSFTPIKHFQQLSLVCNNWATVAKHASQLNLREARLCVSQGLQLMAESNYPAESVKLFSYAIDLYPKLTEASFWKAKGLFILNDEVRAVHCLERALIQRPAPVERLKLQACIYYAQNNDLKASQLLETALQKAPYDASIHFELGFCYHGLQQFSRAIDSYTRALDLKYHRTFVLLANRANCLFRMGKIKESLEDLEASLKISAHYELALRTRAFVNMHLGNTQLAFQDYTTIIENSKTPKVVSDAYCNRAFCNGEMDEADIERARQADPTNPEPIRYKASVLVNRNNIPEAVAHVTQWIEANLTHKDCAFQRAFRAELHVAAADWARAISDYQDAITSLANSPGTLNYGGCNVADTLLTYRERLRDLIEEQRRAAARQQA